MHYTKADVYHVKRDLLGKDGRGIVSGWRYGDEALSFPRDYDHVAMVRLDAHPDEMLDQAYRLTNHIDRDWAENREVKVVVGGGHRSTDIGDIFVIGQDHFIVMPVGFLWLDPLRISSIKLAKDGAVL